MTGRDRHQGISTIRHGRQSNPSGGGIFGQYAGLQQRFGPERVFGTPLSEDAMTGTAVGMALAGLRPIHVHIRMDFLMLAMNQLVNVAAKSRYMFGGQVSVPLVVRSMIGRSWGQGAQHSQSHAMPMIPA